jgi:hypothetical protein
LREDKFSKNIKPRGVPPTPDRSTFSSLRATIEKINREKKRKPQKDIFWAKKKKNKQSFQRLNVKSILQVTKLVFLLLLFTLKRSERTNFILE